MIPLTEAEANFLRHAIRYSDDVDKSNHIFRVHTGDYYDRDTGMYGPDTLRYLVEIQAKGWVLPCIGHSGTPGFSSDHKAIYQMTPEAWTMLLI